MDFVEVHGIKYKVKVNANGEHYYNIGPVVYRLPWLDNEKKPYCKDYHNCPGWIQGHGCDHCDYQPDTRDQKRKFHNKN